MKRTRVNVCYRDAWLIGLMHSALPDLPRLRSRISTAAAVICSLLLLAGKAEAADNIALHKSYSMNPAPNYSLTTDPGDAWQLTDGKRVGVGRLWTSSEAVGWVNARPVEVTIDLAGEATVVGVAFSTAAGTAGVQWPRAIYVLGSRDGRRYTFLGDLIALDAARSTRPPSDGYATYTFQTGSLTPIITRYVRLIIDGQGPFVFADEVEVFGAATAGANTTEEISDTNRFFWQRRVADVLATLVTREQSRITERIGTGPARSPAPPPQYADAPEAASAPAAPQPVELPLPGRQSAAFASLGAFEQSEGAPALSVWAAGPWDPLQIDAPAPRGPSPPVVVHLMNGETRAAAIDLRNSTARAITCTVSIDIDGTTMPAYVSLRRVLWTARDDGEAVASILSRQEPTPQGLSLAVPAGATVQVWIAFSPADLTPGVHGGRVTVRAGTVAHQVGIELRLFKSGMPRALPLLVGGWDYTDGDANGASALAPAAEIVGVLREHGVNVAWATGATLGFAGGAPITSGTGDAPRLESWLAGWRPTHRYRFFLNVADSFGQTRRGSAEFAQQVSQWAEFWSSVLRKRGIVPDAVDLLLVDEPHSSEQIDRIADWAAAIHQAGVGFRVLVTLDSKDPHDAPDRLVDAVDGIIFEWNRSQSTAAYQAVISQLASRQKTAEFYGTQGPALSLDPYGYYRLQAWQAFATGAIGSSFWGLTDTGGALDSSGLTSNRPIYAPLAFLTRRVVATKQLEAIREGAEDYYYLDLLRRLSGPTRDAHSPPALLSRARLLLSNIQQAVLEDTAATDPRWLTQRDRSRADIARISAGELIDALAAPHD